jgi:hypothetical protein
MSAFAQYSYSAGLNSSRQGTTSRAICNMLLAVPFTSSCLAASCRSAQACSKVMGLCCVLLAASAALRGTPRTRRSMAYTMRTQTA